MSAPDDGGPALPLDASEVTHTGMTLRDYFAARVAQSLWANNDLLVRAPTGEEASWIAAIAYEQAHAMLKERAK